MSLLTDLYNKMRGQTSVWPQADQDRANLAKIVLPTQAPTVWPRADQANATLNKIVPGRSLLSQVTAPVQQPRFSISTTAPTTSQFQPMPQKSEITRFDSYKYLANKVLANFSAYWPARAYWKKNVDLFEAQTQDITKWMIQQQEQENIVSLIENLVDKPSALKWSIKWTLSDMITWIWDLLPDSIKSSYTYPGQQEIVKLRLSQLKDVRDTSINRQDEELFAKRSLLENIQDPKYLSTRAQQTVGSLWAQLITSPAKALSVPASFALARKDLVDSWVSEWKASLWSLPIAALDVIGLDVTIAPIKKLITKWVTKEIENVISKKWFIEASKNFSKNIIKWYAWESVTEWAQEALADTAKKWKVDWGNVAEASLWGGFWGWFFSGILGSPQFILDLKKEWVDLTVEKEIFDFAQENTKDEDIKTEVVTALMESPQEAIDVLEKNNIPVPVEFKNKITTQKLNEIKSAYKDASVKVKWEVLTKWFKRNWYVATYEKSSSGWKVKSEYVLIRKKWAPESDNTKIRLSDHSLPQYLTKRQAEREIEIDKFSEQPLPIEEIIDFVESQKTTELVTTNYGSARNVKDFKKEARDMQPEELAWIAIEQNNSPEIIKAAQDELQKRVDFEQETALYETSEPKVWGGKTQMVQPKKSLLSQYTEWLETPTTQDLQTRTDWFTFDIQNGGFYVAWETDGIAVTPFPNRSFFLEGEKWEIEFGDAFDKYVLDNADMIEKWLKIGGYYSDSRQGLVLDLTVLVPPTERAFAEQLAKDTNQESIFDLSVDPNNGYIETGWTGLVPEWFDEKTYLDIITPYLSNQPSYENTSNLTTPGLTQNEQWTAQADLTWDVSQDNGTTEELVSPFAVEWGTTDTTKKAFIEWDIDTLTKELWEGSTFVMPDTDVISTKLVGHVSKISPEEYKKRTGEPLMDWQNAYQVNTVLSPNKKSFNFEIISGIGTSWRNAFFWTWQEIKGWMVWDLLTPILTLSKTATVAMDTKGVQAKLWIIYDEATGRSGTDLVTDINQRAQANVDYMLEKWESKKKLDRVYADDFSRDWKKMPLVDAMNILEDNLKRIFGLPTKNRRTGQSLSQVERTKAMKTISDFMLVSWKGVIMSKNKMVSEVDAQNLAYIAGIYNAYTYYPEEVRSLLGDDMAQYFQDMIADQRKWIPTVYELGWNALVQVWELYQDEVWRWQFSAWHNIDVWQVIPEWEDLRYSHYLFTANNYSQNLKEWKEVLPEWHEDLASYLDYLYLQRELWGDTSSINDKIKMVKDSITKQKWDDVLDVFRVEMPYVQEMVYAGHVSNVIKQKELLTFFQSVEKVFPNSLNGGRTLGISTVWLLEDMLMSDTYYMDAEQMRAIQSIFWNKIDTGEQAAAYGKTTYQKIAMLASLGLARVPSFIRGLVVLWIHYHNPKYWIPTGRITNEKVLSEFLVKQGMQRRVNHRVYSKWVLWEAIARARSAVSLKNKLRKRYSKAGYLWWAPLIGKWVQAIEVGVWAAAQIGEMTGRRISNFFFTNDIEQYVSNNAALFAIVEWVSAITWKKYLSDGKVDIESAVSDFYNLSTKQQVKIRDKVMNVKIRNYDTQTSTRSSIRMFRNPMTQYLVNYASKMVLRNTTRIAMERSIFNDLKPEARVTAENRRSMDAKALFAKNAWMYLYWFWATLLIGAISWKWDEEDDENDKYTGMRFFNLLSAGRDWALSAWVDIDSAIINLMVTGFHTPMNFALSVVKNMKDLVIADAEKNKTRFEIERKKLAEKLWGIWNFIDLAVLRDKDRIKYTATGQQIGISYAGFQGWTMDTLIPFNVDYVTRSTSERAIKNAEAEWWVWPFAEFMENALYKRQKLAFDMAWKNNPIVSFTNRAEVKTQFSQIADWTNALHLFDELVQENPKLSMNEVVPLFLQKYGKQWMDVEWEQNVLRSLYSMAQKDAKANRQLNKLFQSKELNDAMWFAYSSNESAKTTWNNLKETPEMMFSFVDMLLKLKDVPYAENEMDNPVWLKKLIKARLQDTSMKSYVSEVMWEFYSDMRFDNSIVRAVNFEMDQITPKNVDLASPNQIIDFMDRMETMLAVAKNDPLMNNTVYHSLQSAIQKKGEPFLIKLLDTGYIENKWSLFQEATVKIAEDKSLTHEEYTFNVNNMDMNVVGKMIEANNGKMPEVSPVLPGAQEYKKWDTIEAPMNWVLWIEPNGAIYIKDYLGRHIAFVPFQTSLKDGDVVKKWQDIGKAKQDMKSTRFTADAVPIVNLWAAIETLDSTKNYWRKYAEATGNIDFYALSQYNKSKAKTKKVWTPKSQPAPSVIQAWLNPPKKSLLSQHLSSLIPNS